MASLIRDPNRGTWLVQWFNGAKWVRVVVVKKRPGWVKGKPLAQKAPPEAQAALAEYAKREKIARDRGRGYDADRTIEDFLAGYAERYRVARAENSIAELTKVIEVFQGWCQAQKLTKLDSVTAEVCNRWMHERALTKSKHGKKPMAHATLKKERALLATAWAVGLKQGKVTTNPWLTVDVPGSPSRKSRGSWSPAEFEKILAVSGAWLRDILIVGCHTGLRIEALRSIEWGDIRWNTDPNVRGFGFLVVRPELDKAGKGYTVPIHPKVHDVLARRFVHKTPGVETVLTGMKGRPIGYSSATDQAIISACKRAGLKRPDSPNHHMRRTFGRWAIQGHLTGKPVPIWHVSKWMGHSSIKMTEQYLDMRQDESTAWMLGDEDAAVAPGM